MVQCTITVKHSTILYYKLRIGKDKKIIITIVRQNLEIKTEFICISPIASTDTYFPFMFFSKDDHIGKEQIKI